MWSLVLFATLVTSATSQRHTRQGLDSGSGSGSGWDIRLSVPGEPGSDYPTLSRIPRTTFSCAGKAPGYYADLETNCQAFRVCTLGSTFGFQSFLCPNGTLFNQAVFVCDWWMNVNCESSQQYMANNNPQFGNLKLGQQFMNDIKKMLTHPMRNPYDKSTMKSNYVVMQEYRPPSGQMFPPSANLIGPKITAENEIFSARNTQQNVGFQRNSISENLIGSGSTSTPFYSSPAAGNQRDIEIFQRQQQRLQQQNGQYNQQQNQDGQYNHQLHQTGQYQQQNQYQSGQYNQQHHSNQNGQSNRHQVTQNHDGQYQNGQTNNGQSARIIQSQQQNSAFNNNNALSQQNQFNQGNVQHNQQQTHQRGQVQFTKQNSQHTDNTIASRVNRVKQAEFGISYTKQQYNSNQQTQDSAYKAPLQYSNEINGKVGNEAKQNLVSNTYVPPATVIAKTLTFNRLIQEPKPGAPKSRITFKTWIVKPSKAARLIQTEPTPYTYDRPTRPTAAKLIADPTPYTYARPTNHPAAKLIATPTPYAYNKPTNLPAAKLIAQPTPYTYNRPSNPPAAKLIAQPTPYTYNRPSNAPAAKLIAEPSPYYYDKPTTQAQRVVSTEAYSQPTIPPRSAKIIQEGPYVYNKPVSAKQIALPTVQSTLPSRQYLTPTSPPPTLPARLYIPPTTYKPLARLYIPPSSNPPELSRLYLNPNTVTQSDKFQSAKLLASPSTPSPVMVSPEDKPTFTFTKQSRVNTNHNNLTFTDILTKEKLDITVNDIVKDTRNILGTASTPERFGQLQQAPHSEEYTDDNYLTSEDEGFTESGENLSPATPTQEISKSSRLIVKPSNDLIAPDESFEIVNQNSNRLSNLPFYKAPEPTNTIERTVSLKISIPEKTAAYLFNTSGDSDFDKLEILNTGSSNYLVLTNQVTKDSSVPNFIPLGKLIIDKDSNFSNSQALVFSFLADSINQAKEFNNIAEQNLRTSSQSQIQNLNSEDLAHISNKVAQLTAAQYNTASNYNNNLHQTNDVSTSQNANNQLGVSAKYTNHLSHNQPQQLSNPTASQQNIQTGQFHSSRFQSGSGQRANLVNNEQIYSGQLYQVPVPDVSSIYNGASAAKLITQNNVRQQHTEAADLHQNSKTVNNFAKQSSAEVEIVQSQTLPFSAPAKLQAAPNPETQSFSSQEEPHSFPNFVNTGDGISAQLRDKIVGTIQHPSEENKLVTYKKDQSYYVYTKLDNYHHGLHNARANAISNNDQSAKLIQSDDHNSVSFQLVPSVSYQLEDDKEQQRLLNAFHLDEFGNPKGNSGTQNGNTVLTSNVDYSVEHTSSGNQNFNSPNTLYTGPSSYSAPQASVGRLENLRQPPAQNNNAAKLEQFEDNSFNNGYSKTSPNPPFTF